MHEESNLKFLEVYVDAPLEVCEQRDVKGLYKKARRGELKSFTGIDSPYEPPVKPDLILKTAEILKDNCIQQLVALLQKHVCFLVVCSSCLYVQFAQGLTEGKKGKKQGAIVEKCQNCEFEHQVCFSFREKMTEK